MLKLLAHSPKLQARLDAVRADLDDWGPRLDLAAWLDQRNDPRGEMLRIAHAFATEEDGSPQRDEAEVRRNAWWEAWRVKWLGELRGVGLDDGLLSLCVDAACPFDYFRSHVEPGVAAWVGKIRCAGADDRTAAEVAAWDWLPEVSFDGARLTDAGLAPLRRFTALRSLRLDSDHLTGAVFDTLARLPQLRTLSGGGEAPWLNDNLHRLAELPALAQLYLDFYSWPGTATFAPLSGASRLRSLSVFSRVMPDEALPLLAGLTELRDLNLRQCWSLTGATIGSLAALPALRALILADCKRITNDAIAPLVGLPLESLDLEYCTRLTDKVLTHAGKMLGLRTLTVSENPRITGKGLAALGDLTQLEHLKLSGCSKITDATLAALKPLTNLRILRLRQCRLLTVQGLTALAGLTQLRWLDLRSCPQLTGKDVARLQQTWPQCAITT
jgi:hypothetical protein